MSESDQRPRDRREQNARRTHDGRPRDTEAADQGPVPSPMLAETASWGDEIDPGGPDPREVERLVRLASRSETARSRDIAGRQLGAYVLGRRLGQGGMGAVYEARDRRLGRRVAIKILSSSLHDATGKKRFLREARAASAFDHPNICTVHDIGETDDGRLYMVMALYAGETIAAKLARGPLPTAEAIAIVTQVGQGLARAHEAGVTHRDIKPANIMITDEGVAKILDFGIASVAGDLSLTDTGAAIGTPSYMAPEQARGEPVDARADVWALGALLYEMLAGRPPFQAESRLGLLRKILEEEPEPLAQVASTVPRPVTNAIHAALVKDASQRTPSVVALLESLGHGPPDAGYSEGPPTVGRSVDGRRGLLGLAAVALILGVLWTPHWMPGSRMPADSESALPIVARRPPPQVHDDRTSSHLRIAVLPFDHVGHADNHYFAAGLTEEITRRLSSLRGLGVVSQTSAARAIASGKSLRQIGRELDVAYVLEGTVNWPPTSAQQERFRISPRLVRVDDETNVWHTSYDRRPADALRIQSEIALDVATQLEVNLAQSERRALEAPLTTIQAAYFAYLRGLDYRNPTKFSPSNHVLAVRMFERAVDKDDQFVEAWAELARANAMLYFNGDRADRHRDAAREALERALSLAPNHPAVQLAAAYYQYRVERDYERAAEAFEAVAQVRPNQPDVLAGQGFVERRRGSLERAVRLLERAFSFDPANVILAENIGETYIALRAHEAADQWLALTLEQAPDRVLAVGLRALNQFAWKGCPPASRDLDRCSTHEARRIIEDSAFYDDPRLLPYALALDFYEASIPSSPPNEAWARALERLRRTPTNQLGRFDWLVYFWREVLVFRQLGLEDEAQIYLDDRIESLEQLVELSPNFALYHGYLGVAHALDGNRTDALRMARKAVLLARDDGFSGPFQRQLLAVTLTLTGDHQEALSELDTLLGTSYQQAITPTQLRLDPVWNPLRNDPRFGEILDRFAMSR